MPTRTRVEYLYRDASNYKRWGEFIVEGKLRKEDLKPFLFDGEWFVPTEVGLPHLLDLPMTEDDHWLHEFTKFVATDEGESECTSAELISRFRDAYRRGWFSQLI
ncbi:hypothetical protein [Oricola thermophila]|uniref:Uncharacterized protein n=1 Tax=Oricola thermophila TaxID=2742145 RepID=A0A6N1VDM5_9HYPH|nr:hypothetical protein [Oricola thermophila]QKV17137.1 hypothetical protein HTY61_00980 [Oricola thermophila]